MTARVLIALIFFYPIMFITGLATIKGKLLGLIAGTLIAGTWTLVTLLETLQVDIGYLQLEQLSTARGDPFFHSQLSILLLLLSLIGLVLYTAALNSIIRAAANATHR